MKAEDHPEYPTEQANLQRTLHALAARLEALAQANLITAYEDAAEALLAQYRAEYRALQNVSHSPYFARVDFVATDEERAGTHYIGKKGFEHDDDAVIDWRAPLAALFYRGKAGAVNYASPAGPIRGLMQLKRNLDIQSQQLVAIADDFDIRETRPGDGTSAAVASAVEPGEYLREKLAARRDPYLQDIIATIQAQQYELIQADAKQVLVVQGVAGSGKTSVALHRLAYLLHPGNADGIDAKRCIVFGPNRLFLSYIALVLPDLDIGQVTQTTFVEWACEQLGLDAHRVGDEALDAILSPALSRDERVAHYRRSQLRNSHSMGRLLERYVDRRRQLSIPASGLAYPNAGRLKLTARLTAAQLAEAYKQSEGLPLNRQRERFIDALTARLASAYDDAVAQKLGELSGSHKQLGAQAAQLREEAAQLGRLAILTRGLDDATLKERNAAQSLDQGAIGLLELAEHYQRQADAALARVGRIREELYEEKAWQTAVGQLAAQLVADLEQRWPPLDAAREYYDLLANRALLAELGQGLFKPDEIALIAARQPQQPEIGKVDLSDLPALHFLHTLAEGSPPRYDHIVIDEAQDVSRLQLETVRRFSRNGSLTVLGDLPQSIYAHRGISSWDEARAAFAGFNYGYHEITRSYRTTYEITVFANAVLQSLTPSGRGAGLAEPFERHGAAPQLHRLDDESKLPKAIADSVSQIRSQGYANIAVIAKTVDASVNLAVALYDYLDAFEAIETAEVEYRGGLVILPVHLAKGMEFEATLVVGVDEPGYTATEYDGRLLYVAITRALHVLHLFWVGAISKHLESAVAAMAPADAEAI